MTSYSARSRRTNSREFHLIGPEHLLVALERRVSRTVAFDHHDVPRTARSGFEPERTTACEQVETGAPRKILSQPVEQRFADAVGRRTQARIGCEPDSAAAPCAADDPHLVQE